MTDNHAAPFRLHSGPDLLLFGSLALSFDASAFQRLRSTVMENKENAWLADVIARLPDDYETALSALPTIQGTIETVARKHLVDLRDAFITGRPLETAFPLPNTLLIPLAVIIQLTQYTAFVQQINLDSGPETKPSDQGFSSQKPIVDSAADTVNDSTPAQEPTGRRYGIPIETVIWKKVDGVEISADLYYPPNGDSSNLEKRPVALLIHGGGYTALTRRDIPMKHIKLLLKRGFLPVSIDYRLVPETTLLNGPVADAIDALKWARETLPYMKRSGRALQIDGNKVVAVGWSMGGHLALTLVGAAKAKGVRPPDAVLAFYPPSNLEADWWKHPIYPKSIAEHPDANPSYDLLEGVCDKPLSGYQPPSNRGVPGLFMTLRDKRWRLIIHMNWKAQMVPVLVSGLPTKKEALEGNSHPDNWEKLPWPAVEDVRAISPYAHIVKGSYRTPTFIVHGDRDDLIPWQQSQDTIAAIRAQGVDAEVIIVPEVGHGFDLDPHEDPLGKGWAAMETSYQFLSHQISLV